MEQARKIEAMLKKRKQDAKKRRDDTEKAQPILPPPAGCILRSRMFELPDVEQQEAVAKVLDGVGMEVKMALRETQEGHARLRGDVMSLLEWHKRVARRRREVSTLRDKCVEQGGRPPSLPDVPGGTGRDRKRKAAALKLEEEPVLEQASQSSSGDAQASSICATPSAAPPSESKRSRRR